jgi:hypothetical protein
LLLLLLVLVLLYETEGLLTLHSIDVMDLHSTHPYVV